MNNNTSEIYLNRIRIIFIISFSVIISTLILFNHLDQINYYPDTLSESWCNSQPCEDVSLFGIDFVLVQPSSTLFVYLLGVITIVFGLVLIQKTRDQKSQIWWGRSLILWGLGALFAGTSYQAFSFEIKCAGRDLCLWTSWWEVLYMILSVASVNCMMIAHAYSCVGEKHRKYHQIYAMLNMLIYLLIAFTGAIYPVKFLVSFELMLLFLIPSFIVFMITNMQRFRAYHEPMDKRLIRSWVSLGLVLGIYFLYLILGITEKLWDENIWFSENDVLHIGLILWMVFVYHTVYNYVSDLRLSP